MKHHSEWWPALRRIVTDRRFVIGLAIVVLAIPTWFAASTLITWNRIARVETDPDAATETLNSLLAAANEQHGDDEADPNESVNTRPEPIAGVTNFLLVGSDDRSELDDLSNFGDFAGRRADVIVLATIDPDAQEIRLVSLPRDLLAPDLCMRSDAIRLADAFAPCEGIPATTVLLLTVEQITSIGIDHVATIGLEGFREVVDELGGYRICVDHPVRDANSGLDLPEGCTLADGAQTLAWIRSRHTQELIDGRWRSIPLANDLVRNDREREFLVTMLGRVIDATNVRQLQSLAATIAPYVTVDDDLELARLIQTGWSMRLLGREDITTVAIPVVDDAVDGMSVLRPTVDIASFLGE